MAESQVFDAIEENLPEEEDPQRMELGGAGQAAQHALEAEPPRSRPEEAGPRRDLGDADRAGPRGDRSGRLERRRSVSCAEDFGVQTACGWVHYKFGITLDPAEVGQLDAEAFKRLVREKAAEAYDEREAEYPVLAGLSSLHHRRRQRPQTRRPRRRWPPGPASGSTSSWTLDDLKSRQRDEIRGLLVEHSRAQQQQANAAMVEVHHQRRQAVTASPRPIETAGVASGGNGALDLACPIGCGKACTSNCRPRSWRGSIASSSNAGWRWPSKIAIAPRCGAWSGRWCCKCSTPPGKTTCWRWTTCAPASACAAMPRSIPRSSTSAKACGRSS